MNDFTPAQMTGKLADAIRDAAATALTGSGFSAVDFRTLYNHLTQYADGADALGLDGVRDDRFCAELVRDHIDLTTREELGDERELRVISARAGRISNMAHRISFALFIIADSVENS